MSYLKKTFFFFLNQDFAKNLILSLNGRANLSLQNLALKLDCTRSGNFPYIPYILRSTCFNSALKGEGKACFVIL